MSEAHSKVEDNPLLFWRIASNMATRPTRYPQKAVIERQKKVAQDSIALAEMVPAPPNIRLIDVTTNSARNKIPPELPTSYKLSKKSVRKCEENEMMVRYEWIDQGCDQIVLT